MYNNAELFWVQEEHKNMGAWSYVQPRTQTAVQWVATTGCYSTLTESALRSITSYRLQGRSQEGTQSFP